VSDKLPGCHSFENRCFSPLCPPILGEIVENLGDTPKPPAGGILHLFLGELVAASLALALREQPYAPPKGSQSLRGLVPPSARLVYLAQVIQAG